MHDRKTVIDALEYLISGDCTDSQYDYLDEIETAIALLKEQETPKPIIHGPMEEYWGAEEICPDCGKRWQSLDIDTTHFCPGCGRSVKWE